MEDKFIKLLDSVIIHFDDQMFVVEPGLNAIEFYSQVCDAFYDLDAMIYEFPLYTRQTPTVVCVDPSWKFKENSYVPPNVVFERII